MNIIAAIFFSILPQRYRERFTSEEVPPTGSVLSGGLQAFLCLYFLIRNYYSFMQERMALIPDSAYFFAAGKRGTTGVMGLGTVFMFEYFIHITTVLLLLFMLEGLVRMVASVVSGESVPTLSLKLVAIAQSYFEAAKKERALGERIPDVVESLDGTESIRIVSCRPKPWTQLTTISHDGELFELASEQKSAAPRPFVYLLRRKPPTAVIRGIYSYHPDEVLQPSDPSIHLPRSKWRHCNTGRKWSHSLRSHGMYCNGRSPIILE
jgi:hypothetical protein